MDKKKETAVKEKQRNKNDIRHIEGLPGGPMVKTSPSSAEGVDSIPGQGARIPHASWPKNQKNIKQKQCCDKFNKDF